MEPLPDAPLTVVTGFPNPVTRRLVTALIERDPARVVVAVVGSDQREAARPLCAALGSRLMLVDGDNSTVGAPYVEGAKVSCRVLSHMKGKKIIVYYQRPKKGTRKKNGHRQHYTRVLVDSISLKDQVLAKADDSKATRKSAEKEEKAPKAKASKAQPKKSAPEAKAKPKTAAKAKDTKK